MCSSDLGATGAFQQSLGGMESHFKIADLGDGEDILVTMRLAAVDPGPDVFAHKPDRLFNGAARDAGIDGGLNDLRHGSI